MPFSFAVKKVVYIYIFCHLVRCKQSFLPLKHPEVLIKLVCIYRYPLLLGNSSFAFLKELHQYLLLLNERNPKMIFTFTKKESEENFGRSFCTKSSQRLCAPQQAERPHHTPSPVLTLSISASSHQSSELHLWAYVLYPDLVCASISKTCPKVS